MIKTFGHIFAIGCVLTMSLLTFALLTSTSNADPKLITYQIIDVDCYEQREGDTLIVYCRSWSYKKKVDESFPTNHYDENNDHIPHESDEETLEERGSETTTKISCSSCS